jgi:DNA-binding GntR family transcriptional regulator
MEVPQRIGEAVTAELRRMIVDGRLEPGGRINEVHLAEQLRVSRTPLREALAKLEQEGALISVARVGHFVRPLTLKELDDIYPIRAVLDPEALRLAGVPSSERLSRLRQINARMEAERDPDTIIGLDDDWHRELIAECPNQALLELIEQLIRRTHRYELLLMRERGNVGKALNHHSEIIAALERSDLPAACALLRANMEHGLAPIRLWLEQHLATVAPPRADLAAALAHS